MKTKLLLAFIMAGFIGSPLVNAADTALQAKKDGEVLDILIVLNKNEIAGAGAALKKSKNPAVIKYAELLKKDHTQNLKDTEAVSKKIGVAPVPTELATDLKREGKKDLKSLNHLKSKQFDKDYINAMVKGHTHALKLIDDNLLKNASNEEVVSLLNATRPHIEHHLEDAQTIQKELDKA